jgi:CIC family chloride channel protein
MAALKDKINQRVDQLNTWRTTHMSDRRFMLILSIPTGFLAGAAAVIIKKLAHGIRDLVFSAQFNYSHLLFFICPAIGILLTILFCKYILKKEVGHGIPGILYAISKNKGQVSRSSMWSSIVTSALTVGFGGSVGLEGPSVSTGGSIGSNIAQLLRLDYKHTIQLIGMGGAAALAAIFQAPITGIVFALEVFMIDLSLNAIVPIIVSSFTAILTAYFFLGQTVEYPAVIAEGFIPSNAIYYIGLGLFAGLVSAYFLKVSFSVEKRFKKIESPWVRFLIGGSLLGVLIFLFPPLYGEGYEAINSALRGDYSPIFGNPWFAQFKDVDIVVIILFAGMILLKAFATAFTFGAGGVGGTFAPALFIGAFTGLFFATLINYLGLGELDPAKFALVGMSGLVAGMLHAPLTGLFLIAEITNGYALIVPLMIVSALAYVINRLFFNHSIYTNPVAEKGVLVTHNKDKSILNMLVINQLIETNFSPIDPDCLFRDLLPLVSSSKRNIFPVVDKKGHFCGHVLFDDVRSILFDESYYDQSIQNFAVLPDYVIHPEESMEEIVQKFQKSGKYNIPVIRDGQYMGYISRANVFSAYRKMMSEISED